MAAIKKWQVEIPVLLPEVKDERDHCVERIIALLQGRQGIEKVHISDTDGKHLFCVHYDADVISLERITELATRAGAELTAHYGHLTIEVQGIRHVRHARIIEDNLRRKQGIVEVSVGASGFISIEFDKQVSSQEQVLALIKRQGLTPVHVETEAVDHEHTHDHEHKHEHTHAEGEEHDHDHGGIFGKNTELIFSLICGAFLAVGFGLSFVTALPAWVSLACYIAAYFFGGYFTAKEAVETVMKGKFEIDFLMLVAAVGAGILGAWQEGALLLFLFSLGHALEHYAMNKARKSIAALAELAPKTALLKKNGEVKEVGIEQLQLNDIIVVKPNTKIPADGMVVAGSSSVNQAPITGESIPVDKKAAPADSNANDPVHTVFAGSINGNGSLEIKVLKLAQDSTLSRLVKLVNEAQTQKSPTQQFTDRFEKYFVPAVLILVVLLCFAFLVLDETFSDSFYRAMAVLVASSPCALAISTPSAVLSGVGRAAREGVLIKGGRPLEDLGTLTALAFDKTGTLTEGKPRLTKVIPAAGVTEDTLLEAAVAVEALSDHPLAKAIVTDGKEKLKGRPIPEAQGLEAVLGKGIKANWQNSAIYIGNRALFEELGGTALPDDLKQKMTALESEGNTSMLVRQDDRFLGVITMMDTPRPEAKAALQQLKEIGIRKMIMLSGDNQQVADAIAQQTGLTEAWGGLLPEQKVEAIKKLRTAEGKVAMIGDGVNDAPAMANSTVGIAMGAAGSDVALETADIALMGDRLDLLPFAIALSRKAKGIIRQNLFISLGMVALLIPLTILGIASIGPAVIAHEGSTLVVVFNALRLLAFKRNG
ncbi:heavy metal translocating P-type ATPase [Chitinophaga arvensicola]|uniref:P-type Zn(2+) transporter n=1 Tax=Chitinophaga arvensicola TaxID=29529 RepID=A0A1I0RRX3_9BACT|nr:heavy metal translocating P-type ATPase [Chitinophaga arvensicola]SEW44026.1 Cd2+/Zn2+-exporting ATPase [Chitinophaga arvensicola]